MSAIVGAIVAGGLIYLNMRQGMDKLATEVTAAATAEALEAARAENAAILGELENDLADIAADILAIKQTLAAQDAHAETHNSEITAALDAIAARLELPLATAPELEPATPTE